MNDDNFASNFERTELARDLHLGQKVRPVLSARRVSVLLLIMLVFHKDYWSLASSIVARIWLPLLPADPFPGPTGWNNTAFILIPLVWVYMLTSVIQFKEGVLAVWLMRWRPRCVQIGEIVALCWWNLWENIPEKSQRSIPDWLHRINVTIMFIYSPNPNTGELRWWIVPTVGWRVGAGELVRDQLVGQCGLVVVPTEEGKKALGMIYRRPGDTSDLPVPFIDVSVKSK